MDTTIGIIADNPTDYRICRNCGAFNWYEREQCHNCGSKDLRELTEKDVQQILKDIEDGYWCCEDCPVSV